MKIAELDMNGNLTITSGELVEIDTNRVSFSQGGVEVFQIIEDSSITSLFQINKDGSLTVKGQLIEQ